MLLRLLPKNTTERSKKRRGASSGKEQKMGQDQSMPHQHQHPGQYPPPPFGPYPGGAVSPARRRPTNAPHGMAPSPHR